MTGEGTCGGYAKAGGSARQALRNATRAVAAASPTVSARKAYSSSGRSAVSDVICDASDHVAGHANACRPSSTTSLVCRWPGYMRRKASRSGSRAPRLRARPHQVAESVRLTGANGSMTASSSSAVRRRTSIGPSVPARRIARCAIACSSTSRSSICTVVPLALERAGTLRARTTGSVPSAAGTTSAHQRFVAGSLAAASVDAMAYLRPASVERLGGPAYRVGRPAGESGGAVSRSSASSDAKPRPSSFTTTDVTAPSPFSMRVTAARVAPDRRALRRSCSKVS